MNEKQSWQALFPKSQIAIALEIVLAAGKGLSKKNPSEHENKVSERLFQKINLNAQFRKSNLGIDFQSRVCDPKYLDPKSGGIVDFAFRLSAKRDTYFAIEAKRLHFLKPSGKSVTGNSEYVYSDQGMLCFTEDRYAEGLNAGAMLGYVYDCKIDSAKQGISKLIKKHAQLLKCKKPHLLVTSDLPNPESGVDETIHALDGRDFRIFHIFLAV